jgi:hypothetical protein
MEINRYITMIESYKKWQPLEGIDNELSIEAIHDDYEGLRIILSGRAPGSGILRITFSHYYMYRNVNESNRVRLWNEANFEDRNWSLFQATSSKLLDWLHEESGQAFDEIDMAHYLIKTSMEVVDVITHHAPPKAEWLLSVVEDIPSDTIIKYGKRNISHFRKKDDAM